MPQRFDTGQILRVTRTPQGGIRVDAAITRTGILEYTQQDGSIRREFRSDSEVFSEESMGGLDGAPVTHLHPREMVTPETWNTSGIVGHVSAQAVREGDKIVARLTIQDGDVIKLIESKALREVSCGYLCDLDGQAGRTDGGEDFDAAQTNIRYNHVALVPKGRAGREVALRLDAQGDQRPGGPQDMKIEIIDGTEYEIGTAPHAKALQGRTDREAARADQEAETKTEIERLRALETSFPERVAMRVQSLALANAHGVDIQMSEGEGSREMTDREIRVAVLRKLKPEIDLSDKSEDYIQARVDAALEAGPPSDAGKARGKIEATREVNDAADDGPSRDEIAYQKMLDDMHTDGQSVGPKGLTRQG